MCCAARPTDTVRLSQHNTQTTTQNTAPRWCVCEGSAVAVCVGLVCCFVTFQFIHFTRFVYFSFGVRVILRFWPTVLSTPLLLWAHTRWPACLFSMAAYRNALRAVPFRSVRLRRHQRPKSALGVIVECASASRICFSAVFFSFLSVRSLPLLTPLFSSLPLLSPLFLSVRPLMAGRPVLTLVCSLDGLFPSIYRVSCLFASRTVGSLTSPLSTSRLDFC